MTPDDGGTAPAAPTTATAPTAPQQADTVVLDVDGTLVDSVFHHVWAWDHAFAEVGVAVPLWRVHRAIGMGGDRLVAAVAGDAVEHGVGDEVRAVHDATYERLVRSVRPLPGADDLVTRLQQQGWRVGVASSGTADQTAAALELVPDAHRLDAVVSNADVASSKPAPDLAEACLAAAGGSAALLVGDTVWDVRTAANAGAGCLGLLSGGVSEAELLEAGAFAVVAHPGEVPDALADLAPPQQPARTPDGALADQGAGRG